MSLNQEIPVAMTLVLNLQKEAQVDPHMPPVAPATLKLQNWGSDESNSYVWGTALYSRYMPTPCEYCRTQHFILINLKTELDPGL